MMKKIGALLVAVCLLMTPLAQASAAGLSANDQRILDALSQPIQMNGRTATIPAEHINQARNELMRLNLTEAEVNQIIGYINEARAMIEAGGVRYISELPQSLLNDIVSLIERAASAAGLTISIDLSGGAISVAVVGQDGNIIGDSEGPIRDTGVNLMATALVAGTLITALSGCAVVAKKKNMFSAA